MELSLLMSCTANVRCNAHTDLKLAFYCNHVSSKRRKFTNSAVLLCGYLGNQRKFEKQHMGLKRFVMQKQIIKRDMDMYLSIFKALHVRGGIRQAPFALQQMRKVGFILNTYSYIGLIHLLLQSGYRGEAMEVYRRMVSEGIKPSMKTFSALMVASGKKRDTETLMNLLKDMESLGMRPDVYTYRICIRVLGRAGKLDDAYGLTRRMEEDACGPDVITYTVLIDSLCNAGSLYVT